MSGKLTTNLGDAAQTRNILTDNINTTTITDITGSIGTPGQILSSSVTGIDWVPLPPIPPFPTPTPTSTTGSYFAPVLSGPGALNVINFIPFIFKYILYVEGPASGLALFQTFRIQNVPNNFLSSLTPLYSCSYIVTGGAGTIITTNPKFTSAIVSLDNTITPTTYVELFTLSTVAPVFVGVPLFKMVIDFTVD